MVFVPQLVIHGEKDEDRLKEVHLVWIPSPPSGWRVDH